MALLLGLGMGFAVAAQVGPIWLLVVRSVIHGRTITGIAIGLGAAVVDTAYGALGLLGAGGLLQASGLRLVFGLLGSAVLALLGGLAVRDAVRMRDEAEGPVVTSSPVRAFCLAVGATAANPLTIVSWAAVFAAASTADAAPDLGRAVILLAGIGIGSLCWFVLLSLGVSLVRRMIGLRLRRTIETLAGLGLIAFAVALAVRTVAAS